MSRILQELKSYESKHRMKIKCPISRWRCKYCPLTYTGRCRKLLRFLGSGDWK